MKNNPTQRLLLGVFSSLLLAAGFSRAANRFDPMNASLGQAGTLQAGAGAPPCTEPCDAVVTGV